MKYRYLTDVRFAEMGADAVDEHALADVSVGSIEPLGMRYGLTMKAWMASARPSATATITTSSTIEFLADFLRWSWPSRRGVAVESAPGHH